MEHTGVVESHWDVGVFILWPGGQARACPAHYSFNKCECMRTPSGSLPPRTPRRLLTLFLPTMDGEHVGGGGTHAHAPSDTCAFTTTHTRGTPYTRSTWNSVPLGLGHCVQAIPLPAYHSDITI